jgi:hypothetical protein
MLWNIPCADVSGFVLVVGKFESATPDFIPRQANLTKLGGFVR